MKKIIFLLFIFSVCLVFGQNVVLNHNQPVSAYSGMVLKLRVENGFNEINSLSLWYKNQNSSFVEVQMYGGSETNPVYSAVIDDVDNQNELEYYFAANLNNGSIAYYPNNPQAGNTFRIMPTFVPKGGKITILSPLDKTVGTDADLIFAASMFDLGEYGLDYDKVELTVNGTDVSNKATVAGQMIVYKIVKPRAGNYNFKIKVFKQNMQLASSSFTTKASKIKLFELPLSMRGSLSIETRLKNTSADANSSLEDKTEGQALYNFSLSGKKSWLRFSTNLSFSSRESHTLQPINRYRLKFYMPHVNLFVGDNSPYFGTYTLSSHNLRGVFAKMYFKYFNLQVTQGQTIRAIDGILTNDVLSKSGTFARNTLGIRTEIGSQNSFLFGLSFVKTKDDIDSIDDKFYLGKDTNDEEIDIVKAEDNFVAGTDFALKLFAQKVKIGAEVAASLHNNNINGGVLSDDELEDMGISVDDLPASPNDLEDIIVINQNMEPLIPGVQNMAFKVYSEFRLPYLFTGISYNQTGSAFNALSASTQQKDTRAINLNNSLMLLKNNLNLGFGLNWTEDNLSEQKSSTSSTMSIYTNVVYRANAIPLTVKTGFNTSSLESESDDSELNNQYKQNSLNYNIGADYLYSSWGYAPTLFSVDYNQNSSKDEENNAFDNTKQIVSLAAKTSYEEFPVTTYVKYSFTLDNQKNVATETDANYNSFLLKADFDLFDDTLRPFVSYNLTSFTGDIDSQQTSYFNVGTAWDAFEDTEFSTRLGIKTYSNSDEDELDYSRLEWVAKVSRRF